MKIAGRSHREVAEEMVRAYEKAQATLVGQKMNCPACSREVIKRTYQHVFCRSKLRRKGGSTCKDRYWNITNPRGLVGPKIIEAVFGSRSDF